MIVGLWVLGGVIVCAVVAEGIAILALAREVGMLSRRLPPAPALESEEGPGVGNPLPPIELVELSTGSRRHMEGGLQRPGILLFLSSRCTVCVALLDELDGVIADWPDMELVPIMNSPSIAEARSIYDRGRYRGPLFLDNGSAMAAIGIATTPRSLVVGVDGLVRAQGVVNNREMIGSLVEGNVRGQTTDWAEMTVTAKPW